MVLPGGGEIRMSQINTELGRGCCPTISLDTAENGGYAFINTNSAQRPNAANPASMSEWWGYNHTATSACPPFGQYAYDGCFGVDYGYFFHNGGCGFYFTVVCVNYYICGGNFFLCQ
jgi:hypothetical protein